MKLNKEIKIMGKAYKVVKRLRNGDRVSVLVPSDHPLYTVYQHQGENKIVETAMCFKDYSFAVNWMNLQFDGSQQYYHVHLKNGETLELWSIEYDKVLMDNNVLSNLDNLFNKEYYGKMRVKSKCWYSVREELFLFNERENFIFGYFITGINGSTRVENSKLTKHLETM